MNPFGMDLHPLIGLTQSGRLEFRNLRNLRIFLSEIGLMYLKKHADCSEKFSKEIYTHENTQDFTFFKIHSSIRKENYSSILPAITDKRVLLGFCMKFKYFEILLDAYLFARFDGFKNALGSWLLR